MRGFLGSPVHRVAVRIFRSVSEWLIARNLATERLRWRVRRFEERGFGEISLSQVNYPHVLIGLNVFMMLLVLVFSVSRPDGTGRLGSASSVDLFRFGAAFTPSIFAGQFWRLITAIFLHGDFMHLLFNCVAIYVIAPRIEMVYGRQRFLALYLLTGFGGNSMSIFLHALYGMPILLVGASGSIFGLLGAGAIYGLRMGGPHGQEIFKFMMTWIVIGVLYSFMVLGDNLAHAGGAISGGLFAQFVRPYAVRTYHSRFWQMMEWACLALMAVCFALMMYHLFVDQP